MRFPSSRRNIDIFHRLERLPLPFSSIRLTRVSRSLLPSATLALIYTDRKWCLLEPDSDFPARCWRHCSCPPRLLAACPYRLANDCCRNQWLHACQVVVCRRHREGHSPVARCIDTHLRRTGVCHLMRVHRFRFIDIFTGRLRPHRFHPL